MRGVEMELLSILLALPGAVVAIIMIADRYREK